MSKLTAKQSTFVQEYLIDFNATRAAIKSGYSERSAAQIGEQNLRKLDIQEAIRDAQQRRALNTGRCVDDILKGFNEIRIDAMQKAVNKDGLLVMADRTAALKALELEGRHYGMWSEKQADSTSENLSSALNILIEKLPN